MTIKTNDDQSRAADLTGLDFSPSFNLPLRIHALSGPSPALAEGHVCLRTSFVANPR
jgi:hypothetical protein